MANFNAKAIAVETAPKITKSKRHVNNRSNKAHTSALRCHARLPSKKDRHVLESSHGKFKTVAELEAHRLKVSRPTQATKRH